MVRVLCGEGAMERMCLRCVSGKGARPPPLRSYGAFIWGMGHCERATERSMAMATDS